MPNSIFKHVHTFKVCNFVNYHTFQINKLTRCNSFFKLYVPCIFSTYETKNQQISLFQHIERGRVGRPDHDQ
jgi:hypothetical protein